MALNITSPVTGAAMLGFTAPTYTLAVDIAPEINQKQWAVTAAGGTQSGVTPHSVSSPFTVTLVRTKSPKTIPFSSSTVSLVKNIPKNRTAILTRKGVTPAAGYPVRIDTVRTYSDITAGAETYDSANVKALHSLHFGVCAQIASAYVDTVISGVA